MQKKPDLPDRKSIRLPGYDYSLAGAYFVTLVTHHRTCLFGHMDQDKLALSPIGELIQLRWQYLPHLFQYLTLGEFIIMPNHLHAILWIIEMQAEKQTVQPSKMLVGQHDDQPPKGTTRASLGSILQNYKSVTSRLVKLRFGVDQLWQQGYYDRVIRNERELESIHEYILANPANWCEDKENR